jgi:protein-L-isoaspartate(D-aspartate) O-methyltransferase
VDAKLEARVRIAVRPPTRVLEVGTSGFLRSLLAQAAEVVSVDIVPVPVRDQTARAQLRNPHIGMPPRQPDDAGFGVIVLTGSTPLLSDAFRRRLGGGGYSRRRRGTGDTQASPARRQGRSAA